MPGEGECLRLGSGPPVDRSSARGQEGVQCDSEGGWGSNRPSRERLSVKSGTSCPDQWGLLGLRPRDPYGQTRPSLEGVPVLNPSPLPS